MTLQMGIALAVVILMIVMIMSDKFSFWRTAVGGVLPAGADRSFHD